MAYWRTHTFARTLTTYFALWCMVGVPILLDIQYAIADPVVNEANKGRNTGLNILLNYETPTINNGTSPSIDGSTPGDPLGNNEVGIQDMFPGYDPTDSTTHNELGDLRQDPSNIATQGVAEQINLQGGTSLDADAYQTIRAGSNNPNQDKDIVRADGFWTRTREILDGDDPMLDSILTSCDETTTPGVPGDDKTYRLEELRICSQRKERDLGNCTVRRDFVLAEVARQVVLKLDTEACETFSAYDTIVYVGWIYNGLIQVYPHPAVAEFDDSGAGVWRYRHTSPLGFGEPIEVRPIQDLYDKDAQYREAWDTFGGNHYTNFGGFLSHLRGIVSAGIIPACDEEVCGRIALLERPTIYAGQNLEAMARYTSDRRAPPQLIPGRYAADPVYHVAWDNAESNHRSEFGQDYNSLSHMGRVVHGIRGQYGVEVARRVAECPDGVNVPSYIYQDFSDLVPPFNFSQVPSPGGWCTFNGDNQPLTWDMAIETVSGGAVSDTEYQYPRWCGERDTFQPDRDSCEAQAREVEWFCRHGGLDGSVYDGSHRGRPNPDRGDYGSCSSSLSPTSPNGQPEYEGCDEDRFNYCRGVYLERKWSCDGFGPAGGGDGNGQLLTGEETIVTNAIGAEETRSVDQNVFGTTVDFIHTPINPGDHGLIAGQYVISDHTVIGEGIPDWTIDDGGSYQSNWDFTFTATTESAPGLEVEASLYEIVENGFTYEGCTQADIDLVAGGGCGDGGNIQCDDLQAPCRDVNGLLVCEPGGPTDGVVEIMEPWDPIAPGIHPMCWELSIGLGSCEPQINCIATPEEPLCELQCDHLPPELQGFCEGDPCWIDAQGEQQCITNTHEVWSNHLQEVGYTDECDDLLARPECTLTDRMECVYGTEDPAAPDDISRCLLRERFFDCGEDVTVPGVPQPEDGDVVCEAAIRCFGDECADTTAENNPDFVRAATAATTMTEITKDMECDIRGDPSSCTIFEGTDSRCKDPRGSGFAGIIPDCCDMAKDIGQQAGTFSEYLQLARVTYRLAKDPTVASWLSQSRVGSYINGVTGGAATPGAGSAITTGFTSALRWAGVQVGYTGATATAVSTATQAAASAGQAVFGPLQQFIAQGVYDFLASIGQEVLADALFETAGSEIVTGWAEGGLGEMVGSVLSVIGWIYTVYNVLKIIGNLVFACEEEELAFGIQWVNRACHYVGSYCAKDTSLGCVINMQTHCCYSGPFARIITEQLRLQGIGGDWGTAVAPNCEGVSISELENIDWEQVDMSEWEAIMFEAGLVPDPAAPPGNFIPTERHPGDSEGGAEGQSSTDINIETIELIRDPIDTDRFELGEGDLEQPDPDLMPWYPGG